MSDVKADFNGGYHRVEILTEPVRRRRWSEDEKAQILGETLVPGARVSDVARRWKVGTSLVFTWRRQARQTPTAAPMGFVPIVTERPASVPPPAADPAPAVACIDIHLADAVVRVAAGAAEGGLLTVVLRAVRASALPR